MRWIAVLIFLMTACLCLSGQSDAAQKKKTSAPQAKPKIDYYELCKLLVAKDKGTHVRVQRYRLTKDGTLHCWYYG
ncbi:MAG: hypothetical protein JNM20_16550 [Rhizobiales bacterium]|nr:hypothetical protein [Hyphomicrobiales bacterium]